MHRCHGACENVTAAPMSGISLLERATLANFDEQAYLIANADVARAVRAGKMRSGREHFIALGLKEKRRIARMDLLREVKGDKTSRIKLDLLAARFTEHVSG